MNFDQWMEEISKGKFIRRDEEGDSNVLNRANALLYEELAEGEPASSELERKK
jgi:hypothetical protein